MRYYYFGKAKNLKEDLEEEIESEEIKKIEEGFRENTFCDNSGYCCGTSCKYYATCKM